MSGPRRMGMSPACASVHGARLAGVVGVRPVTVTACGFTAAEARRAAHALLQVVRTLDPAGGRAALHAQRGRARPSGATAGERLLRLGDFTPETEDDGVCGADGPAVRAFGAVSGSRYAVPAEVVLPLPAPAAVLERTVVGAVYGAPVERPALRDRLVGAAVADILATDIAVRWWQRPRPGLVRLPLDGLLPEGAAGALHEQGTAAEAYAWPNLPFTVVLAVVHTGRAAAGFGVAAAAEPEEAVRAALLRAQAARLALGAAHDAAGDDGAGPRGGRRLVVPAPTARALAAWAAGPAHLELLRRNSCDGAPPAEQAGTDWVEQAHRRFGHEPLVLSLTAPDGGLVVKAVCPGAAVYRAVSAVRPDCPL